MAGIGWGPEVWVSKHLSGLWSGSTVGPPVCSVVSAQGLAGRPATGGRWRWQRRPWQSLSEGAPCDRGLDAAVGENVPETQVGPGPVGGGGEGAVRGGGRGRPAGPVPGPGLWARPARTRPSPPASRRSLPAWTRPRLGGGIQEETTPCFPGLPCSRPAPPTWSGRTNQRPASREPLRRKGGRDEDGAGACGGQAVAGERGRSRSSGPA